eukprot:4462931-Pyramimonas_sp.AAC.1
MAEAMRVSRRAARTRVGRKKRDGRLCAPRRPTVAEWLSVWSLPGAQGGKLCSEHDWGSWMG